MCGGVLQNHGRIQSGVYRGCEDFQVPGKNVGTVRRLMAVGPPECQEVTPIMESAGENSKEGGGGATNVRNFLSGGGPVSLTFLGGDLGFVRCDVPESGWDAHGIPKEDNRTEGIEEGGR